MIILISAGVAIIIYLIIARIYRLIEVSLNILVDGIVYCFIAMINALTKLIKLAKFINLRVSQKLHALWFTYSYVLERKLIASLLTAYRKSLY